MTEPSLRGAQYRSGSAPRQAVQNFCGGDVIGFCLPARRFGIHVIPRYALPFLSGTHTAKPE